MFVQGWLEKTNQSFLKHFTFDEPVGEDRYFFYLFSIQNYKGKIKTSFKIDDLFPINNFEPDWKK